MASPSMGTSGRSGGTRTSTLNPSLASGWLKASRVSRITGSTAVGTML